MAKYEIRKRANIGTSSLILIFIVLCLATFGMLSLGSSRREEAFSQKNAAAVQAYYEADRQGEAFLQQIGQALSEAAESVEVTANPEPAAEISGAGAETSLAAENRKARVLEAVGQFYQEDTGLFCTDIVMESGLALRIEAAVDWDQGAYEVRTWKVYDREEYEIDQKIPVWTGEGS